MSPLELPGQDSHVQSTWWLNIAVLGVALVLECWLALSLLWRVSHWRSPKAMTLNEDYGLAVGSQALEVAAHAGSQDFHLTFGGQHTFLVFGAHGCEPCHELLANAAVHPATRPMRLVYVADGEDVDVEPQVGVRWEIYRFHGEERARRQWRAPASPYFHVIDGDGRIAAKGIANRLEHLDRLLDVGPSHGRLLTEALPRRLRDEEAATWQL